MKQKFLTTTVLLSMIVASSVPSVAAEYVAAGKLIGGFWHIVTMNADGSNEQVLTQGSYDDYPAVPSSDGSELAFMSTRSGLAQIYIMNRDGSNVRQVTFLGSNRAPSWSPDGSRIVFAYFPAGSPAGPADIATVNVNGTGFVNLTNSPTDHESDAVFNADGLKLAFTRGVNGSGAIWTMNSNGANQTQITFDGWDEWHPTWSSDGSRVAYHGLSGSDWDVKSVLSSGGGSINHTPWAGSQEQGPSYMRDGQILFTGSSLGAGIYRLNPVTNSFVVVKLGTYTAPAMGYVALPVQPTAYTVLNGLNFGGNLSSLFNSDNNKVSVLCDEFDNIGEIQFAATLPEGAVNQLKFRFEGCASRNDVSQFVRMFNFSTNTYTNVSVQTATLLDSVVEGTISSGASSYISGAREVKSRVFWVPQNDINASDGWVQSCDQAIWSVL